MMKTPRGKGCRAAGARGHVLLSIGVEVGGGIHHVCQIQFDKLMLQLKSFGIYQVAMPEVPQMGLLLPNLFEGWSVEPVQSIGEIDC
jgi:hypothetical protein